MCLMCMAGSAVALSIELLHRDCVIVLIVVVQPASFSASLEH